MRTMLAWHIQSWSPDKAECSALQSNSVHTPHTKPHHHHRYSPVHWQSVYVFNATLTSLHSLFRHCCLLASVIVPSCSTFLYSLAPISHASVQCTWQPQFCLQMGHICTESIVATPQGNSRLIVSQSCQGRGAEQVSCM